MKEFEKLGIPLGALGVRIIVMAVPKSIQTAKGSWKGRMKLNLPWLPPENQISESDSSMQIETDSQETFATITYDWQYEGKRQESTTLISGSNESNAVQFAWVDSWHQSEAVLHLKGEDLGTGPVKARGEWNAGEEVWGWTIEFLPSGESLTLKMENITPAGDPTWAVEAVYQRA